MKCNQDPWLEKIKSVVRDQTLVLPVCLRSLVWTGGCSPSVQERSPENIDDKDDGLYRKGTPIKGVLSVQRQVLNEVTVYIQNKTRVSMKNRVISNKSVNQLNFFLSVKWFQ